MMAEKMEWYYQIINHIHHQHNFDQFDDYNLALAYYSMAIIFGLEQFYLMAHTNNDMN